MKKLLSFLLVFVLVMSMAAPTLAVVPGEDTVAGSNGLTLQDHYSADHYDISTYLNGDTIYVITILDNRQIQLATSEIGSDDVYSLCTTLEALNSDIDMDATVQQLVNNQDLIKSIIQFSSTNTGLLTKSNVSFLSVDNSNNVQPYSYSKSDYNALINEIKAVHGEKHSDYNWSGISSNYYNGVYFKYKQNLTYEMTYRGGISFLVGSTLGELVAAFTAKFPLVNAVAKGISTALNIVNAVNTILVSSGIIASYYGSAVYCRYVMINDGGPYYSCYKTTDYEGWVEAGVPSSAYLANEGTSYSPLKSIFDSYTVQRERAYENYSS